MQRKHILSLGVLGAVLSGCSSYNTHLSYNENVWLGEFRAMVIHARKYAGCAWESQGRVGERVQYDYGCHGGAWNTSTLLVNQTQQQVDSIRVLWRERPNSPTYADERRVAEEFLLTVLGYATPQAVTPIRNEFFKHTNKEFWYGPLRLKVSSEKQTGGDWLNRLVVTDTRDIHMRPQFHQYKALPHTHPYQAYPYTRYDRPVKEQHDPYAKPAMQPTPKDVYRSPVVPQTAAAIQASREAVVQTEKQTLDVREYAREQAAPTHVYRAPLEAVRPKRHDVMPETSSVIERTYRSKGGPLELETAMDAEIQRMETLEQELRVKHDYMPDMQPDFEPVDPVTPADPQPYMPVDVEAPHAPITSYSSMQESTPSSREERLHEIMKEAGKEVAKPAPRAPSQPQRAYISHEEQYLRDVEDEVFRQMKEQYEINDKEGTGNWKGLKSLRESLEITEFNLPDEGGL